MQEKIDLEDFEAVIYDMDGLLIDSEPLWQEAEMKLFKTIGIELTLANCLETTGLPTKDVIAYWYAKHPWKNKTIQEVEDELYLEVIALIHERGKPMPGVIASLQFFKEKGFKIALASASPMPLVQASITKCELEEYFDFFHSGTLEKANKPNPALYHTAAKNLATPIEKCIIMEDSGNGVKGAVASGAFAVAIPSPHDFDDPKFDIARAKYRNMDEFIASL
ncbi:sugar-phosphatase [Spirosomataceae bacterium TFI 002]|nr:sugar-phosphatase [Spirosomataceae bacterium TFI 002]